jgi:hypothetical protein
VWQEEIFAKARKNRTKSQTVINTLLDDQSTSICILCATDKNLTKEHVIPKWTFENNQNKNFVTDINGLSQSYKTTLPACSHWNSYLMGALEPHLELSFLCAFADNLPD